MLYGAGDVATKAAVGGGVWLALVPAVLAAHGLAFVCLQFGFQRGGALATAGTSTLLTNALPIAGGIALFHERVPGGGLGALRARGLRAGRGGGGRALPGQWSSRFRSRTWCREEHGTSFGTL